MSKIKNTLVKNLCIGGLLTLAVIAIVMVIVGSFDHAQRKKDEADSPKARLQNVLTSISHPLYRQQPDILVDRNNDISQYPLYSNDLRTKKEDATMLWAERIDDGGNIWGSYTVRINTKDVITFVMVTGIRPDYPLNECEWQEKIKFIRREVEHKYFVIPYAIEMIWAQDAGVKAVSTSDIHYFDVSGNDGDHPLEFSLEAEMAKAGYSNLPNDYKDKPSRYNDYQKALIEATELAKLQKKGFYGTCADKK